MQGSTELVNYLLLLYAMLATWVRWEDSLYRDAMAILCKHWEMQYI